MYVNHRLENEDLGFFSPSSVSDDVNHLVAVVNVLLDVGWTFGPIGALLCVGGGVSVVHGDEVSEESDIPVPEGLMLNESDFPGGPEHESHPHSGVVQLEALAPLGRGAFGRVPGLGVSWLPHALPIETKTRQRKKGIKKLSSSRIPASWDFLIYLYIVHEI